MELHPESERIYINNPKTGLPDAEIFFPEGSDGIHNITHTIVLKHLEGKGIAGLLTQACAEMLRLKGKKTRLTCSYAQHWFDKHPEYSDVLYKEEETNE